MRDTSSLASPLPAQLPGVQSPTRAPFPQDAVCPKVETTPTLAQTITPNSLSTSHSRLAQSQLQTYLPTSVSGAYTALLTPDVLLALPGSAPDALPCVRPSREAPPSRFLKPVFIGRWPHFCLSIGCTGINIACLLQSHSLVPLSVYTLVANGRRRKRSRPSSSLVKKGCCPQPPLVEKVTRGRSHSRHLASNTAPTTRDGRALPSPGILVSGLSLDVKGGKKEV